MLKEVSRRDFLRKSVLGSITAGVALYGMDKILRGPNNALADGSSTTAYVPTALSAAEYATVNAVAARIIPEECDHAGATKAKVGRFIDSALGDKYDYKQSSQLSAYQAGVVSLDAACVTAYGANFVNLTDTQKDAILTSCEDNLLGASLKSFFTLINMHTWEGFLSHKKYGGNANNSGWDAIGYVPSIDEMAEGSLSKVEGGCYQCHDFGNPNTGEHWLLPGIHD
jgi:hypothetical protein